MAQQITIDIIAETQKLQKGLDDANKKLQGIQTATQNVQNLGTAFAGVGVAAAGFGFVGSAIKGANEDASNLQQQFGAIDSVFEGNAQAMKDFATNAYGLGLSAEDAARNSVLLGTFLKGAGLEMDTVSGKTQDLTLLAADLAATYGGTASDAIESLTSAFRGEFNPIEKYGVSLRKSDITARLAAQGMDGLTGEALKQAEVMATLELIFEKTVDAQGQAEREAGTYAAKQAELEAATKNLSAQLGEVLLPIMTSIATILKTVVDIFAGFPKPVQNTILAVGGLVAVLGPTVLLSASLIQAFGTIKGVLKDFSLATKAAEMAQKGFNLVLGLNPLTKVVLVIGLVVAALVYFFTQTEVGRRLWEQFTRFLTDTMKNVADFFKQAWENISKVVTDVFEGISETVNSALNFIGDLFKSVLEVIRRLVEGDFTVIKEFIENIFKGIQAFLDAILNAIFGLIRFYVDTWTKIFETGFNLIKGIVENVMGIIEYLIDGGWNNIVNGTISAFNNIRDQAGKIWGEIKSKITGFIDNIVRAFQEIPNTMYNLGRNIVEGIWNGISGLTTWFRDKVLGFFGDLLPGWVKDVLGISSPSKLFEEIGKAVVQGTVQGLDVPKVSAGQGIAGQQAVTININAGLGTDPYELGRAVTDALNKYASISRIRVV